MTSQQLNLFRFLKRYIGANGYSPSYDEMQTALRLHSKSGIHRLVHALKDQGMIHSSPNRARSIYIIPEDERLNETRVTLQFADGCETSFPTSLAPDSIRRKFLTNKPRTGIVGVRVQ